MKFRLFLGGLVGLVTAFSASAQTYVTTPGGREVRLRTVQFGVPYASPYTSDVPVEKYQYYLDESGERVFHGLRTLIFVDGSYKELMTFEHGVKNGKFSRWYDRGPLEVEGQYVDGQLEGEVLWYYASGKLQSRETYRGGELEGRFLGYYENGNLREEGRFHHGVKEGPFVQFNENGSKYLEGTYRDGAMSGLLTVYDGDGKRSGAGELRQDLVLKDWQCYGPDGAPGLLRTDCTQMVYIECQCQR